MAGISSNKKVARAARTASGRRRNSNSPIGWYSVLAIIVILGVGLVTFSRQERLDASNPGSTPPLAASADRPGDHWHEAYGIYICDKYVANIDNAENPYGIYTENDGIIHVTPFEKKYAGHNATIDLFAKAVDLKVDRNSVQPPGDPKVYKAGEKCGDKNGKYVVKEWSDATKADSGQELKSNPRSLKLQDKHAIAFAFVPEDMKVEDIPLPPSASTIEATIAKEAAAGAATDPGAGTEIPVDPGAAPVDPSVSVPAPPVPPAP
jgi:hypothetical protein